MNETTQFASAERSSEQKILDEKKILESQDLINQIFGSMTGISAIIDKNRQIIYANNDFLTLIGLDSLEPILGKRTGEIISCIHATDQPFGCGTSEACRYCGAVNVIIDSQRTGVKSTKETRITTRIDGKLSSLDLNLTSTPISLSGELYYVLVIEDISNKKRIDALERIFFHDLLNSASGLNGLLSILKEGGNPEEDRELINLSWQASRDILDEILMHRQLRAAEVNDLQLNIELVNSLDILTSAVEKIRFHEVGKNKIIVMNSNSARVSFETDKTLINRVIVNLLKNALEATEVGKTILTGVETEGDKIRIWVKNETVMPKDVQLQLFQRSFSTKGKGRGIGTYSIRLIVENYLKGKVSFISNSQDGTVFCVELPKIFYLEKQDQSDKVIGIQLPGRH